MALAAPADMAVTYSRLMTSYFIRMAFWPRLMSTRWQVGDGAYQTIIQDVSNLGENGSSMSDRGGDWASGDDPDASQITLPIDQRRQSNPMLPVQDSRQAPLNYLDLQRQAATAELMKDVDDNLHSYVSGFNYASAQQFTLGTNSVNIRPAGSGNPPTPMGTGADKLVYDAIRTLALKVRVKNVRESMNLGSMVGGVWAVMRPELFAVLHDYMLRLGLQWDLLTADLLQRVSIFGGEMWMGRLLGVDIYTSTTVDLPSGTAAKWKIWGGTMASYALDMRSPDVYIQDPATAGGYRYQLHAVQEWGRINTESGLVWEITVDGGTANIEEYLKTGLPAKRAAIKADIKFEDDQIGELPKGAKSKHAAPMLRRKAEHEGRLAKLNAEGKALAEEVKVRLADEAA